MRILFVAPRESFGQMIRVQAIKRHLLQNGFCVDSFLLERTYAQFLVKGWQQCVQRVAGQSGKVDLLLAYERRRFQSASIPGNRYSFVHAENHEGALFGSVVKEKLRIPLVFDMHGLAISEALCRKDSRWKVELVREIEQYVVRASDYIIVVSEYMADYLNREYDFPKHKTLKVYCGGKVVPNVDLNRYSQRDFKVVYAGGSGAYEDIQTYFRLPEAYRRTVGNHGEVKFLHIGNHPGLRHTGKSKEMVYLGRKNWGEAIALMSSMHVGVAPSTKGPERRAASPVKIVDYASCGLPIVTCDAGEWSDNIKRFEAGVICQHSDSEEFAQAIRELRDPQTWKRKAVNAIQMVNEIYDWDVVLRALISFYKEIN